MSLAAIDFLEVAHTVDFCGGTAAADNSDNVKDGFISKRARLNLDFFDADDVGHASPEREHRPSRKATDFGHGKPQATNASMLGLHGFGDQHRSASWMTAMRAKRKENSKSASGKRAAISQLDDRLDKNFAVKQRDLGMVRQALANERSKKTEVPRPGILVSCP
jgi:hypothetical protein